MCSPYHMSVELALMFRTLGVELYSLLLHLTNADLMYLLYDDYNFCVCVIMHFPKKLSAQTFRKILGWAYCNDLLYTIGYTFSTETICVCLSGLRLIMRVWCHRLTTCPCKFVHFLEKKLDISWQQLLCECDILGRRLHWYLYSWYVSLHNSTKPL